MAQSLISTSKAADNQIRLAVWGATPHVITGFGCVMKELLQNLYKLYPGVYDISQVAINYHGDYCEEFQITGGPQNGRHRQWPAAVRMASGQQNLYGQPKFLELLRGLNVDLDAVFLFEDPFWVGGTIPDFQPQAPFIELVRSELARKGMAHVPIVTYFPIDGIPKRSWIENIAKSDIPITYLRFGAEHCVRLVPALNGRVGIIPHGVNEQEFFPIPKNEARLFKRAMLGDKFADKFMFLNVNRNQLRKMLPAGLLAFREFKKQVPNSFVFMNMKPVDVGWNLIEVCASLGLEVNTDVVFPPDFNVNKGLSVEDLNKLFNCADVLFSTAVGGGWELSLSQAFATKTTVIAPANTSHIELCGNQEDKSQQRGILYKSGATLSEQVILPYDNEVIRPMPDVEDMIEKMLWAYNNPEACNMIKENAYRWTKAELSWTRNIVPRFHNAFSMAKQMKLERLKQVK
jgi:glycosyltransferase involved in cell wall biosynthesis